MRLNEMLLARQGGGIREPRSPSRRKTVWERFVADKALHEAYNIKPEEIESLKRAAMLGSVYSKQDLLFMLNVIRSPARY